MNKFITKEHDEVFASNPVVTHNTGLANNEEILVTEHKEGTVKVKLDVDHTDNGVKYPAGTVIETDKVAADFIVTHGLGKLVNFLA